MALRTEKQATEKRMARIERRMWSLAGGEAGTFMAPETSDTALANKRAQRREPIAICMGAPASVRRRRPVFAELRRAWPQQQRHDQQDGQAAGDADEAVDAGQDTGGWRGPLDQGDDEDECCLGSDVADAMLADL